VSVGKEGDAEDAVARRVGQCFHCAHARRVRSAKQSEFWLCERARSEPERYAKYPRLPVSGCPGFERARA
jgi:hypothetical protein